MTLTDMPRRPRDPRGKRMETYHGKRQGAILVVVLVCLILVVAVVANLVRGLWLRQQEGREALSRLQLEILVSDVLAAASARGLAAEGESPPASLYEVSPEAWGWRKRDWCVCRTSRRRPDSDCCWRKGSCGMARPSNRE
ncbi:MAG: hypothetical protein R3C12_03605 [Planctomycetaceae bacterium]